MAQRTFARVFTPHNGALRAYSKHLNAIFSAACRSRSLFTASKALAFKHGHDSDRLLLRQLAGTLPYRAFTTYSTSQETADDQTEDDGDDEDLVLSPSVLGKHSQEVDQATPVLILQPHFHDSRLQGRRPPELQLAECYGLVNSVQGLVARQGEIIKVRTLREKSFFTKGKLHELSALVQQSKRQGTQAVMINTTKISARQQHVLETSWQLPVYDRFAVILAIFESRATTKQAQLQVELAKLDYAKARVVLGTSGGFDRQKGGIGALGGSGGETQLERDRRKLAVRKTKITRLLASAQQHRQRLRNTNNDGGLPVVAVVGYTNAGKTALVRALSEDTAMQPENKLFATLDTAVRSGKLPSGTQALFVDTVGFISDLPTSLVAAFKSTLDDIRQADVLVHVTDASDPDRLDQHAAVMEVLDQLDLPDQLLRQRICVHNKVDLLSPAQQAAPVEVEMVGASHSQRRQALILWQESPALDVSVTRGDNLNELRRRIEAAVLVAKGVAELTIRIGHDRPDVVQFAYKHGTVVKHTVTDDGKNTVLTVLLPQPMLGKLKALKGSRE